MRYDRVKVFHLEPKQDTMPMRPRFRVCKVGMIFSVPGVELENHVARRAIGVKEALQLLEAYAAIPIRMSDVGLKQAVELSAKLNVYAYDAYVLACAINQRASLVTLDSRLRERARELKLDVLEIKTQ